MLPKHSRMDRLDLVQSYRNTQDRLDPVRSYRNTKTGQTGSCAAFRGKYTRLDRLADLVQHSYRNTQDWTDWIMCGIPTETHMTGQIGSCAALLPKHTRLDRHDPVHAFLEKHTRLDRFYPEKSDRSVPVQSCRIMQDRHWILHNPTQAYNTGQI